MVEVHVNLDGRAVPTSPNLIPNTAITDLSRRMVGCTGVSISHTVCALLTINPFKLIFGPVVSSFINRMVLTSVGT